MGAAGDTRTPALQGGSDVTDKCHLPEAQLQIQHEGTLRATSEPGGGQRTRAWAEVLSGRTRLAC